MKEPRKETDWPIMAELEEDAAHDLMRELLTRARHYVNDNKRLGTLTQLAARVGVSVEELRDDARKWIDTDVRMRRIITRLKARLHGLVLDVNKKGGPRALSMLELDLKERQLSSTNRVMVEGTGLAVKIVNFAETHEDKRAKADAG